jgi:hypothetical protein
MKKIFKYATGEAIPEGAVYLSTVTQTKMLVEDGRYEDNHCWIECWLVWHYFLVDEVSQLSRKKGL